VPRLDVWLVEEGLFSSRQAAKRAIKDGLVSVNGIQVKPSKQVSGQEEIVVSSEARDEWIWGGFALAFFAPSWLRNNPLNKRKKTKISVK